MSVISILEIQTLHIMIRFYDVDIGFVGTVRNEPHMLLKSAVRSVNILVKDFSSPKHVNGTKP